MADDVHSPTNPLVKRFVRLRARRPREREGLLVVEGARELTRAVQAGWSLALLASCPERFSPDAEAALALLQGAAGEHRRFGPAAFDRASLRQHPDGLLGLVRWREVDPESLPWPDTACYLVIAGLEKPGNVGALLRSAAAAGVDAVFVTGAGTDLGNPNVVRASMGSLFALPVLALADEHARALLGSHGVRVITTSPDASETFWDADLTGAVAVVIGPEHEGLDAAWRGAADLEVRVPMAGSVDSLNAATAGGLVLYEVLRQRRARRRMPH